MPDEDDEDAQNYFELGLWVRHPTLDLGPVMAPLGLTPDHCRIAGTPRFAPNGRSLPGTYRFSFWNRSSPITGDRNFSAAALALAETLAPHRALFESLTASGGDVAIRLALLGSDNIGARFTPAELARLADLGLSLDVEVFPHMRRRTEAPTTDATANASEERVIYVRLIDEAVLVWRPVSARRVEDDVYVIDGDNPDPAVETWEFCVGDRVRVEPRKLSGGIVPVAVAKAP